MELNVVLERNPTTGVWIAEIPGIAGCYTQGDTREEALRNIREALQLVIETDGIPQAPTVEFVKIHVEA
jgi:predicted RNase H-like HicB family nuclease